MKKSLIAILVVMIIAAIALAGKLTRISEKVESHTAESVNAQLKLSVGNFVISKMTGARGVVAEFSGSYDDSKYRYSNSFEERDSRADFIFESEVIDHHGVTNHDSDDNRWDLSFSPDVDFRFDMEIGAAEADFDLGGLTISDMSMDIGAADANIDFSTPNRTVLRDLKVDAGACDLEMRNLGNSRFEFLSFDGGMGSFTLDFSGEFDFEAEASIDVGMGSIDIIIPESVGVRLEAEENWFNSIDFPEHRFKKIRARDGVWETENYTDAKGKLTLVLEVGMGSADIKFR